MIDEEELLTEFGEIKSRLQELEDKVNKLIEDHNKKVKK